MFPYYEKIKGQCSIVQGTISHALLIPPFYVTHVEVFLLLYYANTFLCLCYKRDNIVFLELLLFLMYMVSTVYIKYLKYIYVKKRIFFICNKLALNTTI